MRIAVLEDDNRQLELTCSVVTSMGYGCVPFSRGQELLRILRRDNFDLLLLDWDVPDLSGMEVLKWVRERSEVHIPVLFITNHVEERDIVRALENGADDFLSKPLRISELKARVRALLRRSYPAQQQRVYVFGDFAFDRVETSVTCNGQRMELKHKEVELAYVLFSNMGRLLSRQYLLETVWGQTVVTNSRSLNTHISRIRMVLGLRPENGYHLTSVYSIGYRLESLMDASDAPLLKASS
jgi:DNA-binding response OmpR family regulator